MLEKTFKQGINGTVRFLIGANIGPIYTFSYLQRVINLFKDYAAVSVRDEYSYSFCSGTDNVFYGPDLVFNLKRSTSEFATNSQCGIKHIVISVIDSSTKAEFAMFEQKYLQLLSDIIKIFVIDGWEINLVSFCTAEGDMAAINKLFGLLQKLAIDSEHIKIFEYKGNVEEILNLFRTADYIVASRFHAMILGLYFERPIFPICYSAKMIHYLEELSFPGKSATPDNMRNIEANDAIYNYYNSIICDCSEHKKSAYQQFEPLRLYIESAENVR